jgi:triacylglycerol esterase/lipase EstA (alpha/beta hydrolase family)
MSARGAWLFLRVALGLCGACQPHRDVCASLDESLKRCGFPITRLDCAAGDRAAADALAAKIDDAGCEGFAQGEDAVDHRLCLLAGWDCPEPPTPAPGAHAAKYPLVFVSGIDGEPVFDWNPRVMRAVLGLEGGRAYHVQVLPWATTAERAEDLWLQLTPLRRQARDGKLNLVCYAVGGLDCRYLVSPGGLFKADPAQLKEAQAAIASITTVATPHRGTRVAEAAIQALRSGTTSDLLATLIGQDSSAKIPDDAAVLRTLGGLTLEALFAFNREVTDAPGVYYQSWAGVSQVLGRTSDASEELIREQCVAPGGELLFSRHRDTRDRMNELLWVAAPFSGTSRDDLGRVVSSPADGQVAVASAKWGTFRGCIPADHYDVVGQIGHTTWDPVTGFDAPRFYAYVATDLAGRGL